MMDPEPTRRAVAAFFAAVGSADREAFLALFHPEAQLEDPVGGPVLRGLEGVARFHKGLGRAWSSLTMSPVDVYVRGPRAAVTWRAAGTSASGRDIAFAGVDTLEVDELGRITRLEGYWDLEAVLAQM